MYQNIWCEKRGGNQVEVHLWDDVAGYQNFVFKNYAYVKDDLLDLRILSNTLPFPD